MTENDDRPECWNCTGSTSTTFYSYHECDNCKEAISAVESTPNDELRELIDKHRRQYVVDETDNHTSRQVKNHVNGVLDDLEQLLEGENDDCSNHM